MTSGTSLITGVDFVCIPAQDFEAMTAFYGETLGLPFVKRYGSRRGVEYQAGNLTLATMRTEDFGGRFSPNAMPIALQVEDVAFMGAPSVSPRRAYSGQPRGGRRFLARVGGDYPGAASMPLERPPAVARQSAVADAICPAGFHSASTGRTFRTGRVGNAERISRSCSRFREAL